MSILDMRYYIYEEAAKILRCSEKTLYNRVRSEQIKPLYNGRRVLFTMECIEEFLQRQSKASDKQADLQSLDTETNILPSLVEFNDAVLC
jgi:hypothetical protein